MTLTKSQRKEVLSAYDSPGAADLAGIRVTVSMRSDGDCFDARAVLYAAAGERRGELTGREALAALVLMRDRDLGATITLKDALRQVGLG
jgi:hypothetical protein